MNTNLISKEDNIAKFTVVFTADEFEDAIVDAYKKNKDKFSMIRIYNNFPHSSRHKGLGDRVMVA